MQQRSITNASPTSYQATNGDWVVHYTHNNHMKEWAYWPHDSDSPFQADTLSDALLFCDDPLIAAELVRKVNEATITIYPNCKRPFDNSRFNG